MTANPLPDDGPEGEQTFISHLVELRERLLRMIVAIVLVFLVLFPFANDLYTFLAAPIVARLPEGSQMIATQVASPFLTPFKLALVVAVFVAMPYLLYQLWSFIAPGLYAHEKRLAVPLLAASIVLFYLGMVFAYFVVFPLVFGFFAAVTPEGVAQMPDITYYLEFVLKLFFAFGVAFEIPIATILLVAAGITTPAALTEKRPYVIVGAFIVGMLLTPPDVLSQTLLAIPMWLLFEAGVLFSKYFVRRPDADDEAPTPASPSASPAAPTAGGGGSGGGAPRPAGDGGGKAGGAAAFEVGREIEGDRFDAPGRFRPLTDAEMEAELDAIEAAERADAERGAPVPGADPIEELLRQANGLRGEGNLAAARHLLYRVLEDGDADQRRVARNILADLDLD